MDLIILNRGQMTTTTLSPSPNFRTAPAGFELSLSRLRFLSLGSDSGEYRCVRETSDTKYFLVQRLNIGVWCHIRHVAMVKNFQVPTLTSPL
ncbi:hypothetical protein AVEN_214470-1 [Araneus ventricosus]|uniref:Uncharacterized protein n=1 Tax=Araneus ventricosus TaxID=182803 RepID=A0A4Y2CVK4_ARAVE|nr:hypothetical protein AVEN_214470-1 [Araneus ventricosus]